METESSVEGSRDERERPKEEAFLFALVFSIRRPPRDDVFLALDARARGRLASTLVLSLCSFYIVLYLGSLPTRAA